MQKRKNQFQWIGKNENVEVLIKQIGMDTVILIDK
jgi:hypothetical protein